MKQQVFYIHGGNAYSEYEAFIDDLKNKELRYLPGLPVMSRWPNTLEDELGGDYEVFKPAMPNKQNAKYEEWKIWFERHFEHLRDGVVVLGESLGGYFLAKYFSENQAPFKISGLFIMSAPYENLAASERSTEDGGDFEPDPENISNISQSAEKVFIVHSKDDFVVPYEHALKYKAALPEAELVTFEDKNHFLVEELPELLEKIREIA